MKASEYKAIREAGVDEFAVHPLPVSEDLPYSVKQINSAESVRACPTGLLRMKVVEEGVRWKEPFTLGCGDQEYERERRNGVLVECPLDRFKAHASFKKFSDAKIRKVPHTKIATRTDTTVEQVSDGQAKHVTREQVVRMIVSKAVILAPWGEYVLIEAERERMKEEAKVRNARLLAAVDAVGADGGDWDRVRFPRGDEEAEPFDYEYEHENWAGYKDVERVRGKVWLTLARAEQIARAIAELEAGRKTAALRLLKAERGS